MNKSKYNNMFKVSPYKRKFLNTKTGILTENDFHEICKYDIHDFATYDLDGNFIKDAEQTLYNTCFLILLSDLNILEVKDFFNYHYDYTPNKEMYLDYLEFGILNDKSIYLGIKELCKKLINDKRKINEQLIYENKIAVQILGYGKQNINPKNQTVLNYITDLLIENDLKPIDAIKILNKSTSNFSPEFKDAHFQNIIDYLKSIDVTNEPQQSNVLPLKTVKFKDKKDEKNYTQKQIAIAYYILGITLNEKNYLGILKKHSQTTSPKILQKLITKNNQLTTLSDNKTTNTKHLRDLNEVKRLLSGIKKVNEIKLINGYISTFESNYKNKY